MGRLMSNASKLGSSGRVQAAQAKIDAGQRLRGGEALMYAVATRGKKRIQIPE